MTFPLRPKSGWRPFKGIALFTPGGDLVYCKDVQKQAQWHLGLCAALQEHFGLAEPPYFLMPGFTATVDCWIDAATQSPKIAAEAYPFVYRYVGLLNAIFDLGDVEWQLLAPPAEYPSRDIFEIHRDRLPQLWESHDLVLDISPKASEVAEIVPSKAESTPQAAVLRLFVSGQSSGIEKVLTLLQDVLEEAHYQPYTLQLVDVSKNPDQAESDQVSATPTLVRVWPKPTRRLVGELANPRAILNLLRG